MLCPPLAPMLSKAAGLPPAAAFGAGTLAAEPKWDGFRCLLFAGPRSAVLQSRSGKSLTAYFPEVARVAAAHLPPGTVVDGVI